MIATLTEKFFSKLRKKAYRDAYVAENTATMIATQVRYLREQRGWTQREFAERLGKPPSVVNRIEDPDYGKLSLQTLLEIAHTLDLGIIIRFVGFPEFLRRTRDVSPRALEADSFNEAQFVTATKGASKSHVVPRFILSQFRAVKAPTQSGLVSNAAKRPLKKITPYIANLSADKETYHARTYEAAD